MAKVFVTRNLPGDHLKKLSEEGYELTVGQEGRAATQEELLEKGKGADALITLLTDRINGDIVDAIGPQLKIVSNYAVGFDNIDVPSLTDRGIVVCNTPSDEVNQAVAEHTWALISALSRRIVEADESVKRGAFKGWEPDIFLGISLSGKTLGIIGLGRIGTMVAKKARGFGMNVIYNKRRGDPEIEKELGIKFSSLDDLLANSDIVTLHVPLTDETRHMINDESLKKMKMGSFLVNTARGAIVDERALVGALRSGHLAGVGLDVYDNEPNIDPELIGMENVILTPHIASGTHEARERMGDLAVSAILDTFSNKRPQNLVNPEVWPVRRK